MPWQETTETGRIIRVAKAADNTAAPTSLPNTGSSFNWVTAIASGGDAYGWTPSPFSFTEDDFEFEDNEGNPITVKPPTATKKSAIIRDEPDTPETVRLTSYEIGEKVLLWATNVTEASDVFTKSATFTRQAILIEVQGLGFHYFPSCEIRVGTSGGGVKTLGTQTISVDVFAGSTLTSGYAWHGYADA